MPVVTPKCDVKIAEDEIDLNNVTWLPQFPLNKPGSRVTSWARIRGESTA